MKYKYFFVNIWNCFIQVFLFLYLQQQSSQNYMTNLPVRPIISPNKPLENFNCNSQDKLSYFKLYDHNYSKNIQNLLTHKLNKKIQPVKQPNNFDYLSKVLSNHYKQTTQNDNKQNIQTLKHYKSNPNLINKKKSVSLRVQDNKLNTKSVYYSPSRCQIKQTPRKNSTSSEYLNSEFVNRYQKHLSDYENKLNIYLKKSDEIIKNREHRSQKMQDQKVKLFGSLQSLFNITNQYNMKKVVKGKNFIEKNKKVIQNCRKIKTANQNQKIKKQRPIDKYFRIKEKIKKQFQCNL